MLKDRQTDRQTAGKLGRLSSRQTSRQAGSRQTGRKPPVDQLRQTDIQKTFKQTTRLAGKQTGGGIQEDGHAATQTEKRTDQQTTAGNPGRCTSRQIGAKHPPDRKTDSRQTGRQKDRQTDRQTN
jgi:hypothetical protein